VREWVLDCSATLPWVFSDEATPECDALLDCLADGGAALVPDLWHLELGNVLLGARRRGRIDQAGIEAFLNHLNALEIVVDRQTHSQAWGKILDLAYQYKLSTYDAAYLELALRRGLPLATLDQALRQSAKDSGVTLLLT